MAQLWDLGVRGSTLDVVAAWKDALLLVALLVVAWHVRRRPTVKIADVLAARYAAIVVVYAVIPQHVLGGEATTRGELLALRHHLLPVAAYALGRLVVDRVGGAPPARRPDRALGARRRRGRAPRPRARLAAGVARLGGAGLVPRAARLDYRRPLRPSRELGLQHGRREQPDPAAGLDVPVAARERVRPRRSR